MAIRNPIEWVVDQFRVSALAVESVSRDVSRSHEEDLHTAIPAVRRIAVADLRDALAEGFEDFKKNRTDVIVLCVFYPVVGLVLARLASGYELLPLLFPLASGFALVGPLAAVGLYEMSRLDEQGVEVGWADAFGVLRSPSFGTIVLLGLLLMGIFALWLLVAGGIYDVTLGPEPPVSVGSFVHDVFTTRAGWAMIVAGVAVGFVFAVVVFAISVISFPLLIDRKAGIEIAVQTSLRAVIANPGPMAAWGLIIAAGLVLGSIPLFIGLIVVLPVLGHATWHLYRKVVPRPTVPGLTAFQTDFSGLT